MAGTTLPHASTGPFKVTGTSLRNLLRGTAAGSTSFPVPSSQTGGNKSRHKHYCFAKTQEWWTCKKIVLRYVVPKNIFWRETGDCGCVSFLLFEKGELSMRENERSPLGIHIFPRGDADTEVWRVAQSFLRKWCVISCYTLWDNCFISFRLAHQMNPFRDRKIILKCYLI